MNRKQRRIQQAQKPSAFSGMTAPHLQLLGKGVALQLAGNLNEAEHIYRTLYDLYPKDATVLLLLGIVYAIRNRLEEGIKLMEESVAINPDYATKPEYANAYNNYGAALWQKYGKYNEALASYQKAIALNPDHATAKFNKGIIKLTLGEYQEGWQLYELRSRTYSISERIISNKPLWLGKEALENKTILLHEEQGFGDVIQLCRYVPMVEALGAKVILGVRSPLGSLMSTLNGSFRLVTDKDQTVPEFNLHCPLLSLPLAFGTTLNNIPADIPYLSADPHKRKVWQDRLGKKLKPRIGLVWSGAAGHHNDHNRSIPLSLFDPLLQDHWDFHSLQTEIRPADEEFLASNSKIRSHAENLKDFADTAALVAEMDLIISVDTSVAHLAGALGKPVWILLPFVPDFRWMLEREDSPWYPTVRLFRQPQIGDWESVIARVAMELAL